jgi:hypothetical protein
MSLDFVHAVGLGLLDTVLESVAVEVAVALVPPVTEAVSSSEFVSFDFEPTCMTSFAIRAPMVAPIIAMMTAAIAINIPSGILLDGRLGELLKVV